MKTEYQKACEDFNYKPATLEDLNAFPEEDRVSMLAYHKLTVCLRSRNKDEKTGKKWVANFLDGTRKWWAWFWANEDKSKPSGVGFSFCVASCGGSGAGVGSRLVSKTETIAKEAAKNPEIAEYYNEFLR